MDSIKDEIEQLIREEARRQIARDILHSIQTNENVGVDIQSKVAEVRELLYLVPFIEPKLFSVINNAIEQEKERYTNAK